MKKQLIITLTVLILAITLAGAVSATVDPDVKYVSPTGSDDNDGTQANPYLTIGKGIASVSADGTVNVADGFYPEHLVIAKNVNLVGQSQENTILDGAYTARPITINTGATVSISLFTIRHGNSGNLWGGAIQNNGTLTITNCKIINNMGFLGGAIDNQGILTITESTLNHNSATWFGGAIYNSGTCTIRDSTLNQNGAIVGGAIDNEGSLLVTGSTLNKNSVEYGGAIRNTGTCVVTSSILNDNTASKFGGAIRNSGNIILNYNSIAGNRATNWYDGGDAISTTSGSVNAQYNWWGNNNPNFTTLILGEANYSPWLYMTFQVNPSILKQDESSTLIASFNNAYDGDTITPLDPADGHLIDGTMVTFSTDLGVLGSQVVDKPTISGVATGNLSSLETGTANVKAVLDDQELLDAVEIETAEYNLVTSVTGDGSITKNPDSASYPLGTVVILTANADPGWSFSHWTGDLTGNTNPQTVTMDGDKSITAIFVEDTPEYNLVTSVTGDGSITKNPDSSSYLDGTVVTVTAVANPGWSFSHWTGDLTGNTNPQTVTMDGDKSITAVFVEDRPETGIFTRFMVQDAAIRVRNFITNRGVLPNWVRMEDTAGITHYVTMPVFMELSTASLISSANEFKAMDVQAAPRPVGPAIVNRNLHRAGYMDMALRVNNFIRNNGVAPNFAWSSLGNIRYQALVDSFARIVAFKAERGVLPNFVVINTRRVR